MGKYGKNFRDCCDSPTDGKHVKGCSFSKAYSGLSIKDCFDDHGMIKFDPYRFDEEGATPYLTTLRNLLFTEDGWLVDRQELKTLIGSNSHRWKWDCTAIALYHAEVHASATKGSYPTYYYFR